ncbi:MAG: AI-2E family transporter [Bacilli bacterium]|nr:AI-2E family transporter [Bacilli bacterium]
MIKNKIDFKLINAALLVFIIYLIYQTKDFWFGILGVAAKILFPFFIAFVLAYAIYPLVRKLTNKKIPKALAIIIVVFSVLAILALLISLITPLLTTQMRSLFDGIVTFLKELSLNYNVNFKDIQDSLSVNFDNILEKVGTYISNGAISFISVSLDYISKIFVIFALFIYFLVDMDKIREFLKDYLHMKSEKMFNYIKALDDEMEKYLSGFIKIVFISFFEYTIIYSIIGHPNALLLGGLAAFGNLIPYFGGIITNIIAAITAFVISPALFVKTCIVFMIFSSIDGYVINPLVYGKTNQVHPLIVISSVFIGGILFGIIGIIIALPFSILIIATLKFFKNDLIKMKEKRTKNKE